MHSRNAGLQPARRRGGARGALQEGPGRPARRCDPVVAACLCLLSAAEAAAAPEGKGPLIRCPDWKQPGQVLAAGTPGAEPRDIDRPLPSPAAAGTAPYGPETCIRHRVEAGDTLGAIAARHLGSAARHAEVAAANPDADPKRLRIGSLLSIGCAGPGPEARTDEEAAGTGRKRPGLLARLLSARTSPAPPAPGDAPSSPVWRAEAGEYLIDVVGRWGGRAGYRVVVEDRGDWRFAVPFEFEGPLQGALREVVKGFGTGRAAPLLVVYANRVVRIGAAR